MVIELSYYQFKELSDHQIIWLSNYKIINYQTVVKWVPVGLMKGPVLVIKLCPDNEKSEHAIYADVNIVDIEWTTKTNPYNFSRLSERLNLWNYVVLCD